MATPSKRETPETREAREAEVGFHAGTVGLHEFISKLPVGSKRQVKGKTYLTSMDGPMELNRFQLSDLDPSNQRFRNPEIVQRYSQQVRKAQGSGVAPERGVQPLSVFNKPGDNKMTVHDGHHRLDALAANGATHALAWVPFEKETARKLSRGNRRRHRIKKAASEIAEAMTTALQQKGSKAPSQTMAREPGETHPSFNFNVAPENEVENHEKWIDRHLTPEAQVTHSRGRAIQKAAKGLNKIKDMMALTWAGRHGRHWYDELRDILRSSVSHDPDPMAFYRKAGLVASFSPNNGILPNVQAAEDIDRLHRMGVELDGEKIEPKTRDPKKIGAMLMAYAKADPGMTYPQDYPVAELRGQRLMKAEGDQKFIHLRSGWTKAPIVYPGAHISLATKVLSNPEAWTDPFTTEKLTKTPGLWKAHSFLMNILGHTGYLTADRHEARAHGLPENAPPKGATYHHLEGRSGQTVEELNKEENNPEPRHPRFGAGTWTQAGAQAARWFAMRFLRDKIARKVPPEEAVQLMNGKEMYNLSGSVPLYQSPSIKARLDTAAEEGGTHSAIHENIQKVGDYYADPDADKAVGHPGVLNIANKIPSHSHKVVDRIIARRRTEKAKTQPIPTQEAPMPEGPRQLRRKGSPLLFSASGTKPKGSLVIGGRVAGGVKPEDWKMIREGDKERAVNREAAARHVGSYREADKLPLAGHEGRRENSTEDPNKTKVVQVTPVQKSHTALYNTGKGTTGKKGAVKISPTSGSHLPEVGHRHFDETTRHEKVRTMYTQGNIHGTPGSGRADQSRVKKDRGQDPQADKMEPAELSSKNWHKGIPSKTLPGRPKVNSSGSAGYPSSKSEEIMDTGPVQMARFLQMSHDPEGFAKFNAEREEAIKRQRILAENEGKGTPSGRAKGNRSLGSEKGQTPRDREPHQKARAQLDTDKSRDRSQMVQLDDKSEIQKIKDRLSAHGIGVENQGERKRSALSKIRGYLKDPDAKPSPAAVAARAAKRGN
jgi:hypothetical protein